MLPEKIRNLRKENKLTQKELAKRLGVAPTSVSSWERGSNKPLMDKLNIMAEMFNVPISYFFNRDEVGEYGDIVQLPVYGNASCGDGTVIFEPTTTYEDAPSNWAAGGEYFYLIAEGDSMTGAKINEGDLLLIRSQPTVENGEIAAVVIDDKVLLKRVYRQNGTFTLVSENPKYPPRSFDPNTDLSVSIIGKLKKSITNH